jgi:pyridoxamine 5'-phosphate oxidase
MIKSYQDKYRKDYVRGELNESECPPDPMLLLEIWLGEAIEFSGEEPAMVLSTVGENNRPSSRIVLLKRLDASGLYFFTNYESRKGRELASNPWASANFFWQEMERQIRVEGMVEKISPEESDSYFNSRPEESKISAIISPQSREVPGRSFLINSQLDFKTKLKAGKKLIKRPPYWGGYLLKPTRIEFWQGRKGRLHDRIQYLFKDGTWDICRLAP